jgi:hypothetical protein
MTANGGVIAFEDNERGARGCYTPPRMSSLLLLRSDLSSIGCAGRAGSGTAWHSVPA